MVSGLSSNITGVFGILSITVSQSVSQSVSIVDLSEYWWSVKLISIDITYQASLAQTM